MFVHTPAIIDRAFIARHTY